VFGYDDAPCTVKTNNWQVERPSVSDVLCVLTVHRDNDVLVDVDDDTSLNSLRLLKLNAAAASAAATDWHSYHRRRLRILSSVL